MYIKQHITVFVLCFTAICCATVLNSGSSLNNVFGYNRDLSYQNPFLRDNGCPVCDSSVYSYCSKKMYHDACCCHTAAYGINYHQCQYNDCSYIYANSCHECNLIINCCCNQP